MPFTVTQATSVMMSSQSPTNGAQDLHENLLSIGDAAFPGLIIKSKWTAVADLEGVRGVQMQLAMYFCVNNWTSPSNDYAAVARSNNNQAQLHTRVSVPY